MKIKLIEDTFVINYQTAEFTFREDQRIFFELMDVVRTNPVAASAVINDGISKTLVSIKGVQTEDGKPVPVQDFFKLPREIVAEIRANFLQHILKDKKVEKNAEANS